MLVTNGRPQRVNFPTSLHHKDLLEEHPMNLSPHLVCEEAAHPRGKILRFAGETDFVAVPAVRQF